jgi:hypothetical protein
MLHDRQERTAVVAPDSPTTTLCGVWRWQALSLVLRRVPADRAVEPAEGDVRLCG